MIIRQSDIDRFWSKIIFPENIEKDCWIYNGCKDKDGYGIFSISLHDKTNTRLHLRTHRYMWIINNHQILNNLHVLHKCDNTSCINPNHLFLGTPQDNSQDRDNKNRNYNARGSRSNLSKLTEEIIVEMLTKIYNNKFKSTREVCEYYDVKPCAIHQILNGKSWKHITKHLKVPLKELKCKIMNPNTLTRT